MSRFRETMGAIIFYNYIIMQAYTDDSARRIVLYGGSFNPPHKGHGAIARAAFRQIRPDILYVLPNFRTPFKSSEAIDYANREKMLRLSFGVKLANDPACRIIPAEAEQKRSVYTFESLMFLKNRHPKADFYILIGSDCLPDFKKWKRWEYILDNAKLLVGIRKGFEPEDSALPFVTLKGVFPKVSSSDICLSLLLDESAEGLDPAVEKFIRDTGLYFGKEKKELKRALTAKRYGHSLGVARLAAGSAGALGLSAYSAALAGLFHDCAREYKPEQLKSMDLSGFIDAGRYSAVAENAPVLLHAAAGARVARDKYGINDADVLEAIKFHADGAVSMGKLARLIYVCDIAEPGRRFPESSVIRNIMLTDFEEAFRRTVEFKVSYGKQSKKWISPASVELWTNLKN